MMRDPACPCMFCTPRAPILSHLRDYRSLALFTLGAAIILLI